jgi:hypothetical protein
VSPFASWMPVDDVMPAPYSYALSLKDGSTSIAVADYGGWFTSSSGISVQMKTLGYASGSNKNEWCQSASVWSGATDKGTPGQANDCP